jgi:hypothetical protein
MLDAFVAVLLTNEPSEAVTRWIWLAVIERIYGPDPVEARLLQHFVPYNASSHLARSSTLK